MKVRFAPSPTGKLHVGNIRTALLNYLYCRANSGHFLLRIDDTDFVRSTKEFEEGIREDLNWLGLNWDSIEYQSKRNEVYDKAAADLKAKGLLYACYETSEELDRKRKVQTALGRPPIYDRAALALSDDEKAAHEAAGNMPHWRFKLSGKRIVWKDLVRGEQSVDTGSMSDPVLIRADGAYLYTLPSVVDDVDLGITHVVRGEDHVTNSGAQIEIFEALSGRRPEFGHFPLLVGAEGEALSKRLGSMSIESLREEGVEPMAILSLLAKLGTSDPVEAYSNLDDLVSGFAFAKIGRAPARFNPDDVYRLDTQLLHMAEYSAVKARLNELDADLGDGFWNIIRGNLVKLEDAMIWACVVKGPITPIIENAEFAAAAAECVPEDPFDETTWKAFTEAVKAKTGAKGRDLFMPLRLALTAQEHGPDMARMFALIGREKAVARLKGKPA